VVAAAVILRPRSRIHGVADSKVLSPKQRAELSVIIRREALCFGVGWADRAEIDALNILQATFLAMRRALLAMTVLPDRVLVDGNRLPSMSGLGREMAARAIVGGDATEPAISAASILAKTARDSYMDHMHTLYPAYDFARHKGYGTAHHQRLLELHGPCPLHRRSFAPLRRLEASRVQIEAAP
jgi:ribonuclease HII